MILELVRFSSIWIMLLVVMKYELFGELFKLENGCKRACKKFYEKKVL